MNNSILALLFYLFSITQSVACMIPNQGDEYNQLIKIKKLGEGNLYNLSIPRSLYKSKGTPELSLVYYTPERANDCVERELSDGSKIFCGPKDQYREELNIQSIFGDLIDVIMNNDIYAGDFSISPKKGYVVSINVMWNSEVCPTYASKIVKK